MFRKSNKGTNTCYGHRLGLNRDKVHTNKQFFKFSNSQCINKQPEFEKF